MSQFLSNKANENDGVIN